MASKNQGGHSTVFGTKTFIYKIFLLCLMQTNLMSEKAIRIRVGFEVHIWLLVERGRQARASGGRGPEALTHDITTFPKHGLIHLQPVSPSTPL